MLDLYFFHLVEPIKSMLFTFDLSREESLTQDNSENPYRIMVCSSHYDKISKSCRSNHAGS